VKKISPLVTLFATFMLGQHAMAQNTPAAAGGSAIASAGPVELKAGKSHEKCFTMETDQTLAYRFEAGAKVNFNIHFHKGDVIQYPMKLDSTATASGMFTAKANDSYCMMWENLSEEAVTLNYTHRIVAMRPERLDRSDKLEAAEKPDKLEK
jgi:hypothetical protein